jgi:hypothetical protein
MDIKFKLDMFLSGYPYGILGKILTVEERHIGKYTLWDKIRFRLWAGNSLV